MQAGLRLCSSQTTKDRFSRGEAHLNTVLLQGFGQGKLLHTVRFIMLLQICLCPHQQRLTLLQFFILFSLFSQTHSMTHLMIIPVMEDTHYIEDLTLVMYDKVIAKLVMKKP